ncbi:MAG: type II toxin-antitoxin system prevent-host-death family antitoxin [Xanthomonadales bacterium]|nr:type II toxin-antitoxin system prevent-host-death family antitoxin [Xanthomonadales bacterium]
MEITNISEAKASLSQLIKRVQETGESIIIGKAGKPVAVLSPYRADTTVRKLGGSWEGKVEISEEFDALDSSIENSFYKASVFPKNE